MGVGAGEGLVEEQHAGLGAERPADLDEALLAEGEVARVPVEPGDPDRRGETLGQVPVGGCVRAEDAADQAREQPAEAAVPGGVRAEQQVVGDAEVERELRVLEGPGQALGGAVGGAAAQGAPR
nr:hypothetical protein [Pimelobacter simplex]